MTKFKSDTNKKLKQLIHVAKSKLHMDDDLYRDVLEQVTGLRSTTEMTTKQLEAVLDRLKQSGFTVKSKAGVKNLASDAQSKLIRHLWLVLANAGVVRNSSELALAAWVKRITGVSALQFLSTENADKCINSLRNWCKDQGIERTEPVQEEA